MSQVIYEMHRNVPYCIVKYFADVIINMVHFDGGINILLYEHMTSVCIQYIL